MINTQPNEDSFIQASFIEENCNKGESLSQNFLEKKIKQNVIFLYKFIYALLEYFFVYVLFYFYLKSTKEFNNFDFSKAKYFFFRFISFILFTAIKKLHLYNYQEIKDFLLKFQTFPNYFIYVIFQIFIWEAILKSANIFPISLLFCIMYSKHFFRIFLNLIRKNTQKKLHYRYMMMFSFFLLVVLLRNYQNFFVCFMIILAGFFYFLNDSNTSVSFTNYDIILIHYLTILIIFIFYFISSFFFFRFNIFTFSFDELFLAIAIFGADILKFYIYERIKLIEDSNNYEILHNDPVIYILIISLCLDLFFKNNNQFLNIFFSFIGLCLLFYYLNFFKTLKKKLFPKKKHVIENNIEV